MVSSSNNKGSRTKRGLNRPCRSCGQSFRPKNNKGKFCSDACRKAQARRESQGPEIRTAATTVARVRIRSKSANNINDVSGQNRRPKITPKTGWQVTAGELVLASAEAAGDNRQPVDSLPLFAAFWERTAEIPTAAGKEAEFVEGAVNASEIPERDLSVQLSGWMLMEAAHAVSAT